MRVPGPLKNNCWVSRRSDKENSAETGNSSAHNWHELNVLGACLDVPPLKAQRSPAVVSFNGLLLGATNERAQGQKGVFDYGALRRADGCRVFTGQAWRL
jgi:hypothetical protein